MGIAVIGEPTSVEYDTRRTRAASYNAENMVYCLNGFKIGDEVYEGFDAAAVMAGYIAYLPCNDSITHKVIPGATSTSRTCRSASFTRDRGASSSTSRRSCRRFSGIPDLASEGCFRLTQANTHGTV